MGKSLCRLSICADEVVANREPSFLYRPQDREQGCVSCELSLVDSDGGGVRVLRRPVIRPDVQLLRLAIVVEGGD